MQPKRFQLRHLAAGALIVSLVVTASACANDAADQADSDIVVVDALDRTVTLPDVPDRVTVAGRAAFMIFDAVYLFRGGSDRLTGIEIGRDSAAAFAELVDPDLADKTILQKNVGPEEIAGTDPDLVILKSYMADDLGAPLEQMGMPVLYVDLETPEQYERDIEVLGTVLGETDRAAQILSFYRDRVRRISLATAGLADDARPSVLVLKHDASEGTASFDVPPASWLQTTMVTLAGGRPVWIDEAGGSGWTRVGFEQIAAWNPDQIHIISYTGDSEAVANDLQADQAWQALGAVRTGSIYGWPGDSTSWDQPDSRWILGLAWLFTKVQPDLAGDVNVKDEIELFFTQMYRLSPEDVESEVGPLLFGSLP
jgi:iron complex transport system substrate-binding protein